MTTFAPGYGRAESFNFRAKAGVFKFPDSKHWEIPPWPCNECEAAWIASRHVNESRFQPWEMCYAKIPATSEMLGNILESLALQSNVVAKVANNVFLPLFIISIIRNEREMSCCRSSPWCPTGQRCLPHRAKAADQFHSRRTSTSSTFDSTTDTGKSSRQGVILATRYADRELISFFAVKYKFCCCHLLWTKILKKELKTFTNY